MWVVEFESWVLGLGCAEGKAGMVVLLGFGELWGIGC